MYICIDAGHGGPDRGATGFGATEKWVTGEVAARVGELLHAAGCLVFLTRIGDRRVGLWERARAAQEPGAQLFLSLHCSQSPHSEQRGLAVLYPRADPLSEAWAETVLRAVELRLNGRTVARGAHPIGGRHRCRGAALLQAVHLTMPACCVELGFLSNARDARLLQERLFLEDLARGLAAAALSWQRQLEGALMPANWQPIPSAET